MTGTGAAARCRTSPARPDWSSAGITAPATMRLDEASPARQAVHRACGRPRNKLGRLCQPRAPGGLRSEQARGSLALGEEDVGVLLGCPASTYTCNKKLAIYF